MPHESDSNYLLESFYSLTKWAALLVSRTSNIHIKNGRMATAINTRVYKLIVKVLIDRTNISVIDFFSSVEAFSINFG